MRRVISCGPLARWRCSAVVGDGARRLRHGRTVGGTGARLRRRVGPAQLSAAAADAHVGSRGAISGGHGGRGGTGGGDGTGGRRRQVGGGGTGGADGGAGGTGAVIRRCPRSATTASTTTATACSTATTRLLRRSRAASPPGQEICNNGIDDDDDGLIDCADPDCMSSPACRPTMGMEICDNGVDDNGDGLVDCSRSAVRDVPGLPGGVAARPTSTSARSRAHGAHGDRATMNTAGATVRLTRPARRPAAAARVGSSRSTATADVRSTSRRPRAARTWSSLFRAGANQACDPNLVACLDAGADADGDAHLRGAGGRASTGSSSSRSPAPQGVDHRDAVDRHTASRRSATTASTTTATGSSTARTSPA